MALASGRPFTYALKRLDCRKTLIGTAAMCGVLSTASCSVYEPPPYHEGAGSDGGAAPQLVAGDGPPASPGTKPRNETSAPAGLRPRVKPEPSAEFASARTARRPVELPALLGLSHQEISRIFGRPGNVERSGASVLWNYDTSLCSLQIVFYGNIEDQSYHALQYALTDSNGQKPENARRCLEQIRAEARHGK